MQWRGFGMDLGTKFFQGEEMEGVHFGQVRTLRGVILDKIGDWGGVIWTSEEIEGGGLILDKWRDWGDHGHVYIRNFLLTIDIEGDHLSLPCPYLVCVKGVGQGWSKEIQGRHVEHMMLLRGSFWKMRILRAVILSKWGYWLGHCRQVRRLRRVIGGK